MERWEGSSGGKSHRGEAGNLKEKQENEDWEGPRCDWGLHWFCPYRPQTWVGVLSQGPLPPQLCFFTCSLALSAGSQKH